MDQKLFGLPALSAAALFAAVVASPVQAVSLGTFGFSQSPYEPQNSPVNVGGQLFLDVYSGPAETAANQTLFRIRNTGTLAPNARITAVYFDTPVGTMTINTLIDVDDFDPNGFLTGDPNVDYSPGANPGQPQGGLTNLGGFNTGFSADPDVPQPNNNSINANEFLGVLFDGTIGAGESVLVGLHVQSLPNNLNGSGAGQSDWYVSDPVVVPVPAAVWLFGSGLLGLVGIARRRRS